MSMKNKDNSRARRPVRRPGKMWVLFGECKMSEYIRVHIHTIGLNRSTVESERTELAVSSVVRCAIEKQMSAQKNEGKTNFRR